MTNAIAQFNIQFDALEDRLQLRVLSTNDEEIRLWLTRRYVRLLLKALADKYGHVAASEATDTSTDFASGVALDGAANGGIRSSADRFADPYRGNDDTHLPLGEEPKLVSRIALQEKPEGNVTLVLGQEEAGGMQIELGLNRELVVSLQAMLVEAASTAEWDLGDVAQVEEFTEHLTGVVLH